MNLFILVFISLSQLICVNICTLQITFTTTVAKKLYENIYHDIFQNIRGKEIVNDSIKKKKYTQKQKLRSHLASWEKQNKVSWNVIMVCLWQAIFVLLCIWVSTWRLILSIFGKVYHLIIPYYCFPFLFYIYFAFIFLMHLLIFICIFVCV